MQNTRIGEDGERFMEMVLQALESHPLENESNTIFIRSECFTFERFKKLLKIAKLRAEKRIQSVSPQRRRNPPTKPGKPSLYLAHSTLETDNDAASPTTNDATPETRISRPTIPPGNDHLTTVYTIIATDPETTATK